MRGNVVHIEVDTMATWAGNDRIFDTRDAQLLEALGRARMLSTSQLQRLVGGGEPLGALVERLKRLGAGGWVRCLPRVATSTGPVAAWHRADEPLPEEPLPVAQELLRLNEAVVALASGSRPVQWSVQLGSPPTARFVVPGHGTFHLLWAHERSEVRAACLHFGSSLVDPEDGSSTRSRPEALVLCEDEESREALQKEVEAWQQRFPDEPAPVRLATADEGVRVLRALIHGEVLATASVAEPPVEEITDDQRERIARFLDERG